MAKKKKFRLTVTCEYEAEDVTKAGLMACKASMIAGCHHGDLVIKTTEIKEREEE